MCEALTINDTLQNINLNDIYLSHKSIKYLSDVLKVNNSLLNIHMQNISNQDSIQYLSDALEYNINVIIHGVPALNHLLTEEYTRLKFRNKRKKSARK